MVRGSRAGVGSSRRGAERGEESTRNTYFRSGAEIKFSKGTTGYFRGSVSPSLEREWLFFRVAFGESWIALFSGGIALGIGGV